MNRVLHIAKGLTLPLDGVTQTFAEIGRKGAGKTYLATMIAEQMLDAEAQVVALDPVGNWFGLRIGADGKSKGKDIFVIGGEHGDVPLTPEAGVRVAKLIVEKRISAVLDVSAFRIGERKRFAAAFGEELFHLKKSQRTPMHLFVEEAQLFAPQRPGPDEARMLGAFESIVRLGRNYGIGASLITQRPQSVNKEVLSQVECLCVLQVNGTHERKALEEWVQEAGADRKLVGELPGLERGEGYVWSPSWLRIFRRVHFSAKTTFDASATPEVGKAAPAARLSSVDVEALRADLAEVVAAAEQEDPKALRRQLADARAQLKKLEAAKAPAPKVVTKEVVKVDSRMGALVKKLQKAVEQAMKFIVTINTEGFFKAGGEAVDKVQVQKAIEAAVANVTKMLEQKVEQRNRDIDKLRSEASKVLASLKALTLEDINVEVAVKHNEPFTVTTARNAAPAPRGAPLPAGGDTKLNRGAREMLRALAAFNGRGLTRAELGVHAVLGYQTGTFSDYLSAMRRAGYIVDDGPKIGITAEGLAAAGGVQPPRDWAELVSLWTRGKVGGGARRMLEALAHSRASTSREQLGEQAQLGHETGTFSDYLSLLRRNGLIEEGASRGEVKAADALFLSETVIA